MRRPSTLALLALSAALLPPAPSRADTAVWVPTLALGGSAMVSAFLDGTAYAGYTSDNEQEFLLRSTDHGTTWRQVSDPNGDADAYRFSSPTDGVAVEYGAPSARRTTDGAATWEPTAPYPFAWREGFVSRAVAVHGRTIVVSGHLRAPWKCAGAAMAISDDHGRRWRRAVLPTRRGWSVIADTGSTRLYGTRHVATVMSEKEGGCEGSYGVRALYVTHDGGRTFLRNEKVCQAGGCAALGWVSATTLVVGRHDGTTAISTDGGRTFREGQRLAVAGSGSTVQSLAFLGRIGYASTGAATWRTTTGGSEWTLEVSHESSRGGAGRGDLAIFDAQRAVVSGKSFVSVRRVTFAS